MTDSKSNCPACGKGILQEASLYDDLEGYLTCSVCNHRTKMHSSTRLPFENQSEDIKTDNAEERSFVSQREYERYQREYPEPPEVHSTEEDFQRILKYFPDRKKCSKDKPADLTLKGIHWYHMDAKEIYDDGEHYLQYECLNCGSTYDVWIPDC